MVEIPHCVMMGQVLFQVGPGLEYILKGSESLWIKSISEVIILCRYYENISDLKKPVISSIFRPKFDGFIA